MIAKRPKLINWIAYFEKIGGVGGKAFHGFGNNMFKVLYYAV